MSERHLPHDWFSQPLPENVELGERSWLYSSFAFRHYHNTSPIGLRVGHDTGIYHGTFFNLGPQAKVTIGNFCSLVGVTFSVNTKVTIGDYALMAHEVVIADTPWVTPLSSSISSPSHSADGVDIAENVWIGAEAILLAPVQIGEGAIIGAKAIVTGEVPAFSVWAGNPGRVVGSIGK